MSKQEWTKTECDILRELFCVSTGKEMKKIFPNRSLDSINCKANEFGLIKTPNTVRRALLGHKGAMKNGGICYKKGYKLVLCKGHPNADRDGYIAEHRLIMEQYLGRTLKRDEHIHHINRDITDNRIENLQLMSLTEHTILHHRGAKRSPEVGVHISKAKKEANIRRKWELNRAIGEK
jgi:hypothetical protein